MGHVYMGRLGTSALEIQRFSTSEGQTPVSRYAHFWGSDPGVLVGQAPDVEQLRALPGVRDATLNSTHLTIAFEGSADPVVKAIARYEVRSLRSREDEFEEIFLRYYRRSGDS